MVEHAAAYAGLAAVLAAGVDDETSELHASCLRMTTIGDDLLRHARDSGTIRPDVRGEDVLALTDAAAWLREHNPAQADRLLILTLAGMRHPPAT